MSVLHEARVVLQPNEEWRFEVDHGSQAVISLAEGRAELFGSELVPERRYAFSGAKLAVFSWHGCTLEVEGAVTHQYIARETPMLEVLAIHEELESRRHAALGALGAGPRVMVVGPDDSGKTTMCRLLANYAAWRGHGVTYVDLDVSQPSALVPGAITASAWPRPLDVEQGHEFTAPVRARAPRCRGRAAQARPGVYVVCGDLRARRQRRSRRRADPARPPSCHRVFMPRSDAVLG
jgi:polyribonucleotide 5'-hydroxyl-kinase